MCQRKQFKVVYDPINDEVWVRYNRKGSTYKEAALSETAVELCCLLVEKGKKALRLFAMSRYLGYQETVMCMEVNNV